MDGQTARPFVVKVSGVDEVRMLAAITLGAIVPRLPSDLMFATALTDFHRTLVANTEWSPRVPVAAFRQSVFNFVECVEPLSIFVTSLFVRLFARFGDAARFSFPVGSTAALRFAITHLGAHSVKPSFIHSFLVLLLSGVSEANMDLRVYTTDRRANALETLKMEPLVDTITITDSLTKDMFAA